MVLPELLIATYEIAVGWVRGAESLSVQDREELDHLRPAGIKNDVVGAESGKEEEVVPASIRPRTGRIDELVGLRGVVGLLHDHH